MEDESELVLTGDDVDEGQALKQERESRGINDNIQSPIQYFLFIMDKKYCIGL